MSPFSYPALALIFFVPALGGLLFGYDIGSTSFAISMITSGSASAHESTTAESQGGTDPWWTVPSSYPALEEGLIVSAVCFGALLGSFVAFRVGDDWGRRSELRVAAVLYLLGAVLNTLSGTVLSAVAPRIVGVVSLLVGRLMYGSGVGFAMHSAPTYMAEMTPPSVRGAVVTAKEAFIVLGMLIGYVLGYLVSGNNDRWYVPYTCSMLIALPLLASTYAIPRSARWLILQGRVEEACESLRFLYNDEVALRKEFDSMKSQLQEQRSQQSAASSGTAESRNIFSSSVRKALVAGIGLIVFQQITGQPSVMTYVTIIFQEAGLGGESSVLVSVFMLISTLGTVVTVDRFGRKTLLLVGCSMMLVALTVLAICFSGQDLEFGDDNDNGTFDARKLTTLLSMLLYIGGYEVGFGPIAWLLLSEFFPLDVRGQAVALGVQVNFALNFVVQLVVPLIQGIFGLSITFSLFAILTIASLVFIQVCVVETKGLSLEMVDGLFQKDTVKRTNASEPTESDVLLSNLT